MSGAGEWARGVPTSEFVKRPQQLDLEVTRAVPVYHDALRGLVERYGILRYERRERMIRELTRSDPSRAARMRPPFPRVLAGYAAVLLPATAMALVVSRAAFDLTAVAPWFAVLETLAAAAAAGVALPLRISSPPARGAFTVVALPGVLGAIGLAGAVLRAGHSAPVPGSNPWWWLGVAATAAGVVLAVACAAIRARAGGTLTASRDGELDAWRAAERRMLAEFTAEWLERIRAEWRGLADADRATVSAELDAAVAALRTRRLLEEGQPPAPYVPGLLLLDAEALDLPSEVRVDDLLSGMPPTR